MSYTVEYQTKIEEGKEVKEGTIYVNGHFFRTLTHPDNSKLESYIENLMYMLFTLTQQDQLQNQNSR